MYTISKLCNEYNLSRSTLLYYDKIGLLVPSERTKSNYRVYSISDKMRLKKICSFREAGVSLEQIKNLLDYPEFDHMQILEKRLNEINHEMRYLRCQQNIIIEMLKVNNQKSNPRLLDKNLFISILKSTGIEDKVQDKLHNVFEKNSPEVHQLFLEFLGISLEEIKLIRDNSRNEE